MTFVMYSTNKVTIMSKRHPQNHNLTLHLGSQWQGNTLLPRATAYIAEYLANIQSVINDAVNEHPRSIAIRCDLRFPFDYNVDGASTPISRFMGFVGRSACISAVINGTMAHGNTFDGHDRKTSDFIVITRMIAIRAVSYTHLTLPTSDLV